MVEFPARLAAPRRGMSEVETQEALSTCRASRIVISLGEVVTGPWVSRVSGWATVSERIPLEREKRGEREI